MGFKKIYLARRNPSVAIEDWPRTWRSHAVYVSQFSTVESRFSRVMYCSRIADTTNHGLSTGYDGVALVSCETQADLYQELPSEVKQKVDTDELRVFDGLVESFTLNCSETLIRGDVTCTAAIIQFLARKSGTTPEDLERRWSAAHEQRVANASSSGAVVGHVYNRVIDTPPPGYEFDGISELWFANDDEARRAVTTGTLDAVVQDLAGFCDMERSVTLLTRVTHLWPRG